MNHTCGSPALEELYTIKYFIQNAAQSLFSGETASTLNEWNNCVLFLVDQEINCQQFYKAYDEYIKKYSNSADASEIHRTLTKLHDQTIDPIQKYELLTSVKNVDLLTIFKQLTKDNETDYALTMQKHDLQAYYLWLKELNTDGQMTTALNEVEKVGHMLDDRSKTSQEKLDLYELSDLYKKVIDAEKMLIESKAFIIQYQHASRENDFSPTEKFTKNIDNALYILYDDDPTKSTLEKAFDYKCSDLYKMQELTKELTKELTNLLPQYESYVKESITLFKEHRTEKLNAIYALQGVLNNQPNPLIQLHELSNVFDQKKITLFQQDSLGALLAACLAQLMTCLGCQSLPTKSEILKQKLQIIQESIGGPEKNDENDENTYNNPSRL